MSAPEWVSMTDWSNLPDVYVTKAECQQGMFWRIDASSVPMAIGPEVRLIRADRVAALIAAAEARGWNAAIAAACERLNRGGLHTIADRVSAIRSLKKGE